MAHDRTFLGVLAKHWTPGAVKTRLASAIGDRQAAIVYLDMLQATLTRFAGQADRGVVAFTPQDRRPEFAQLVDGQWSLENQSEGDLGERLAACFLRAFEQGFTRVVLIGADTPTLPVEFVSGAFLMLKRRSVVFGPSADGGYYLVGAACRVPPVFRDIPWGTSEVWTTTRQRMEQAGLSWGELPAWWDVDDERDYRRLLAEGYRMSS
jgi:rSAM/selenodomain-associated transferase 1